MTPEGVMECDKVNLIEVIDIVKALISKSGNEENDRFGDFSQYKGYCVLRHLHCLSPSHTIPQEMHPGSTDISTVHDVSSLLKNSA